MAVTDNNISLCVEALCSHGCGSVSVYIALLKSGEVFPEVADLSVTERQQVLDELLSVMAPYEEKGED